MNQQLEGLIHKGLESHDTKEQLAAVLSCRGETLARMEEAVEDINIYLRRSSIYIIF